MTAVIGERMFLRVRDERGQALDPQCSLAKRLEHERPRPVPSRHGLRGFHLALPSSRSINRP